jgi:hypothetical protein
MLEESTDVVITTTSAANRIIRARFKSRCNGRSKALGELHNRASFTPDIPGAMALAAVSCGTAG